MGELHLEVALNELKAQRNRNLRFLRHELFTWKAHRKEGVIALAKSPNKQSSFWVQVQPEQEHGAQADEDSGNVLSIDEHYERAFGLQPKNRADIRRGVRSNNRWV